MNGATISPLAFQPKRAFHHRHAAAADMRGNHGAVLFSHARQEQARPAHVDALPDAQFQLAVAFVCEVREQRCCGHRSAAGGGILGEAARAPG